jgi:hypothetical protein
VPDVRTCLVGYLGGDGAAALKARAALLSTIKDDTVSGCPLGLIGLVLKESRSRLVRKEILQALVDGRNHLPYSEYLDTDLSIALHEVANGPDAELAALARQGLVDSHSRSATKPGRSP